MNLAVKIYNKYGQEVYGILKRIRTGWQMILRELVSGQRTILRQRQEYGRILISVCGVGYCIHCFRRPVRAYLLPQEELTAKTSELLGIDKDIIEKIIWICQLNGKSL